MTDTGGVDRLVWVDNPASPQEIAWAAGLFEGEGSFTINGEGYARCTLATTDIDVLQQFHGIVAVGSIKGPYQRAGRKPYWQWTTRNAAEFEVFARQVEEWLGQRRTARLTEIRSMARKGYKVVRPTRPISLV